MLLIITNEEDIHPNPVIDKLITMGTPFFRLNTENLISHYDISYSISNTKSEFIIKYKDGSHSINSDQIKCIWERRPIEPLSTFDSLDNEISKLVLEEADGFLRYLRYSLADEVPWIGHSINERKAGSKILQKIIGKKIGFSIPDTLFTNSIESINNFEHEKVAVKPISAHMMKKNNEETHVFYTSLQSKKEIINTGEIGIRNTINFLESYIDKDYEIRATVIVDEIFAAKINSQDFDSDKGKVDWRQGYDHGINFTKTELPQSVCSKCFEFLKYFELSFGCFDFIVDKSGEYHFLECNTNGQWMWLEEEADLPISDKLANIFSNYCG